MTKISSHQYHDAKQCKRIVGFDANALYLYAIGQVVTFGKEKRVNHDTKDQTYIQNVLKSPWFGYVVNIEIPKELRKKFEEVPPFFFNKQIPEKAIPKHMKDYAKSTGRSLKSTLTSKKLYGSLSGEKYYYMSHFEVVFKAWGENNSSL